MEGVLYFYLKRMEATGEARLCGLTGLKRRLHWEQLL